MVRDFLDEHGDKLLWYGIIFGAAAGIIFVIYIIFFQATVTYAFLQGMAWGIVSTVLSFVTIMGWKHLK